MATYKEVSALIDTLSPTDLMKVIDKLQCLGKAETKNSIDTYVANTRFAGGYVCPICGCINIVRYGKTKSGTQRYLCKECGHSFVASTNSIAYHTKHSMDVWDKYIRCMFLKLTLEQTAEECGIHLNTAWRWRHKILQALGEMADDVYLRGLVEADETYMPISFKGNHTSSEKRPRTNVFEMPRSSHKHGDDYDYQDILLPNGRVVSARMYKLRGISRHKICVPCAVTRKGLSIAKLSNLGRPTYKDFHKIFDNRIEKKSTLCTDKHSSYIRFANDNNLELVQLKSGESCKGIYNIQHINSYHSQFKNFIKDFKGISTKYLNHYMTWNNILNYSNGRLAEKERKLKEFVLSVPMHLITTEIDNKSYLPIDGYEEHKTRLQLFETGADENYLQKLVDDDKITDADAQYIIDYLGAKVNRNIKKDKEKIEANHKKLIQKRLKEIREKTKAFEEAQQTA